MVAAQLGKGLAVTTLAATLALGVVGGAAGGVLLMGAARTPGAGSEQGAAAGAAPSASSGSAPDSSAAPSTAPVHYVGTFGLVPERGTAGTLVHATGSGFPSNAELALGWNTVEGRWVLGGDADEQFLGRTFDPVEQSLGAVTTDANGAFTTEFRAPQGYGFSHDVTVERAGTVLNKAGFQLDPTVTVTPASGPPGTPIQITMDGIGWGDLQNSWLVTYDNAFVGWLSSVTTGGLAQVAIPATGGAGQHLIRIIHGSFTVPYLNIQQSPQPDRPTFDAEFTVTNGPAVIPGAPRSLPPTPGLEPAGGGTAIWTDPASATVGTALTVHGRGFDPGAAVQLDWSTVVGNRVGGNGWDERVSPLEAVNAGSNGAFMVTLAVPNDLGGGHRISASVGGDSKAETSFVITPSAAEIEPSAGPVGSDIVIHLNGVGWTETANIYTLVYDNAFLGYACGFNSGGDVVIHLRASGAPGWHFIDLYPAIYKGKDIKGVDNFRIPQLTAAEDHPGEHLPIFHFAFEVQGPPG